MWSPRLRLLFFITAVSGSIASCASPCRELADQICDCEPTELERLACVQRVENAEAETVVSDAQMQVCSDLLASGDCTCDGLANSELAACGLAIGD